MKTIDLKNLFDKTVATIKNGLIGKTFCDPFVALLPTSAERQMALTYLGRVIKPIYGQRVVAVVYAGECWYVQNVCAGNMTHEEARRCEPMPSQHPERKEAVAIGVLSVTGKTFGTLLDIEKKGNTISALKPIDALGKAPKFDLYILECLLNGMK